jgi:hypothetical protein
MINYHLSRCTPQRMLYEFGQVGNAHGLSTESHWWVSTGWCSHCSRHHVESCDADLFQHPAECPKLAQPITGGYSTFGGHENMVGKREYLNNSSIFNIVILLP